MISIKNKVSLFPDTFNNKQQQIHTWWLIISGLGLGQFDWTNRGE